MLSKKQEFELLTSIRSRGEIPLKFVYLGEGALSWDEISKHESNGGILSMESSLLSRHMADFLNAFSGHKKLNIVDLGCGNGVPAISLISKAQAAGFLVRYVPMDISGGLLDIAARNVRKAFPDVLVLPRQVDFEAGNFADFVYELSKDGFANLFVFFGNTLGNASDAGRILTNFRDSMGSSDYLLVGTELANLARIDLIRQRYADHKPIRRIHMMLPCQMGISEDDVDYEVSWNEREQQIESKIRLKRDVQLQVGDESVCLKRNECLLLMRSRKYNEHMLTKQLSDAGFRNEVLTTDPERSYILTLIQPTRYSV